MPNHPKTVNLLDLASDEDLKKIKEHQSDSESYYPVDTANMTLAEFGLAYGWAAYKDARDNVIPSSEMYTLLECKRKLDALKEYKMAEAALIGSGSANTKKPYLTFKKLTRHIIKRIKVQE